MLTKNKCKTLDCIVFGEIIYDIYNGMPQLGGAPLNYAWYLSQFGMEVLFISSVGKDKLGRQALEKIESNNLIFSSIAISDIKTGIAQISGTPENPEFIINKGVAWDKINLPHDISKYQAKCIYFGTLSQRTTFNQTSLKILLKRNLKSSKMFDLNLRKDYHTKPIIEYSLKQSDFVKMNQVEFEYICKLLKIHSADDLLSVYDINTILITNGDKQVNLINKQTSMTALPPKSNTIDTIGAGDAFFATFTAGLIKNLPLNHILSKSCEIASYITETQGAIVNLPQNLKNLKY